MVRLFIVLAAAALVLLILALISGLSAERVRNMPRAAWVLVILLIPIAGPAAYFVWGRPVAAGSRRAPSRPSSPDDDPEFLRSMNIEKARREREMLARWEQELGPGDKPGPVVPEDRGRAEREIADRETEENGQPDGEQKDEKKP
ncbi:PLD nuclease N-terminal domain-containing protein [Actinoplanes sp. DH11]|uniref:PLD nuclease N-terminal domain-containing protein n=1 Tax=Actinoplanes sp. DH11 TaxID=2857011 RepID=UPI001E3617D3|nr:PLDc N-terminal domain-containing protein [Actinoplanes sp. DH11]